ncbi:MAG: type VI secretion system baseplate subunit TssG [Fibromonadaceae bacterium]|jgi:predicted component of type VI protein secretion system|nr:type VI secretion system baseplate subunit TssG [Fibromonadaceae bacterium]
MGIKSSFFEWIFNFLMKKSDKKLRIIASNSLKHPLGDIDFVETKEEEVLLAVNEMSLTGADSPLPDNFLRGIRVENENSLALSEFLNTLQHQISMLRFDAILERSSFFLQKLGNEKWKNRFASYNERFSPEYLRCFFSKMFPNAQVSVHCFEPLRIENPSPIVLGKANLNNSMLLGKFCTSITEAMRVDVKDITLEQSIELKRKKNFITEKFPFKIKIKFSTKAESIISNKLSENFWLGNFLKWEMWV